MFDIIIISLILFSFWQRIYSLCAWLLLIMAFQLQYERGNVKWYLEIINDYPLNDCIEPNKSKFLFKNLLELSNKGIPKEMFYCENIKIYSFIVYSVLFFLMFFIDEYRSGLIGIYYIYFYSLLLMIQVVLITKKIFLRKFKVLNRYTIKYLLKNHNSSPPDHIIGKCKIVAKTKQFNKTYVTVIMEETGEVKEKVLLQRKILEDKAIYDLYEIENVYYID